MGGFARDCQSNDEGSIFPEGRKRLIVTPDAFVWLLKQNPTTFPDVTSTQISDKSKADSTAKALILVQGTLFF